MYFPIALFAVLIGQSFGSYSTYITTSPCISAESSSSYKWCRFYQSYAYGYYCTTSDTSTYCGGDSYYRCSSETNYLPQNSKKLLCPVDTTSCNTQTLSLATNTSYTVASSNYFSTSTLCWYKFTPSVSSIKSIKIAMTSLSNANAEVYVETSTNVYSYKGSVTSGNSINIDIDTYDPVWVLVTPITNNAYVYITAYASAYSSTYSTSLSYGAVVAIVICTICCGCCCICIIAILIIGIIIGCSLVKKNQNLQRNQSTDQYVNNSAAPPDMINNYQYQVPPPSDMQPSYIQNTSVAYPTPGVYTGKPIAMNANPQPSLAPAHLVLSNPVYISKEVEVPLNKI